MSIIFSFKTGEPISDLEQYYFAERQTPRPRQPVNPDPLTQRAVQELHQRKTATQKPRSEPVWGEAVMEELPAVRPGFFEKLKEMLREAQPTHDEMYDALLARYNSVEAERNQLLELVDEQNKMILALTERWEGGVK